MGQARRLPSVTRGERFTFTLINGDEPRDIEAFAGETIATALLASGQAVFRYSREKREPRSLFCAVGACYDCVVQVNDQPVVRACSTPAEPGMIVRIIRQ